MKFYSIEDFFIADVGKVVDAYKDGNPGKKFQKFKKSFIKQDPGYSMRYSNIITGATYWKYFSWSTNENDYYVNNLIPFSTYIYEIAKNTKDNKIINDLVNKIINEQKISKSDIIILNKYFNNKNINYLDNLYGKFRVRKEEKDNSKDENTSKLLDTNLTLDTSDKVSNHKTTNNSNKNYIDVLTSKNKKERPSVGIDDIINNVLVILAQEKINPLLIGYNGVGKSTIINELVYKINKKEIQSFLKNTKIIDLSRLITIEKYTDKFDKDLKDTINLCIKNNYIILIDNIHNLYNINTSITTLLRFYIKEKGLKVIGITTPDEYNEIIDNDLSINKFEKIIINEPNDEVLYQIINKVFNDYSKNNKIKLFDNLDFIMKLLIDLTKEENRIWNNSNNIPNDNIIYNPELVIQIIDKIFAYAKVNNQKELNIDNVKCAINACNKIIDQKKNEIIESIDTVNSKEEKTKILKKELH